MKNPLHRKKLQLALRAFTTKAIEKSSELDHIWVTRKSICVELFQILRLMCSHVNQIYKYHTNKNIKPKKTKTTNCKCNFNLPSKLLNVF